PRAPPRMLPPRGRPPPPVPPARPRPPPPPPSPRSLHDALPIFPLRRGRDLVDRIGDIGQRLEAFILALVALAGSATRARMNASRDRKSTRLNSSHVSTSYAVFCLKKKNTRETTTVPDAPRLTDA